MRRGHSPEDDRTSVLPAGDGGADARFDEDGLARLRMVELQRARLLSATFDVVADRGASSVSVMHVVDRAGVSRRTFYEIFTDSEDCFLAAFDHALDRAARLIVEAHESERLWHQRIRAGLQALLCFLDEEPAMGRLLVVESLAMARQIRERRKRVLESIAAAVDRGRAESRSAADLPDVMAEGLVGAVLSVLHARLSGARDGRLTELLNPLTSIVVLPYLGPAAARRELSRPLPRSPRKSTAAHAEPLRELPMRITYRTMLVLAAIADSPSASNREIGDAAGISDQGQASKLLARLRRLGLVENTTDRDARGTPNAWRLTPRGAELQSTIALRANGGRS